MTKETFAGSLEPARPTRPLGVWLRLCGEAVSFLLDADELFLASLCWVRSSSVKVATIQFPERVHCSFRGRGDSASQGNWSSSATRRTNTRFRNMGSAEGGLSQLYLDFTALGDIYGVQVFELFK